MILAIDPGTWQSGWVLVRPFADRPLVDHAVSQNEDLLHKMRDWGRRPSGITHVVIEEFQAYGMAVGKDSLATVRWSGRFEQAAADYLNVRAALLPRKEVKLHLCRSVRAKDTNVWQALVDRFGPGKEKAVGRKAAPGPLYGIHSHERAAMALAIVYAEMH